MPNLESDLARLSASEIVEKIKAKQLSACEVVEASLSQIERLEPHLKAWTHLAPLAGRLSARAVDEMIHRGEDPGPLAGVPMGVKDIFNTYDMPTQMGSGLWRGFTPGNDARVVARLRASGALLLGKTVTAEFAVHTPGPTLNPHDEEYAAGTSSTGAAVSVVVYMVPLGLGTQTAGSIVRPASYCGAYGFKPSFGVIARTGVLKTADTLDTIGFFARTVSDLQLIFSVARVEGPNYPMSFMAQLDHGRRKPPDRPWRIALVKGPKWQEAQGYAKEALLAYANKLSMVKEVIVKEAQLPPEMEEAHAVHEVIYEKSLSYYFKEELKQENLVSPRFREMALRGHLITLDQYQESLDRQLCFSRDLDGWFVKEGWDALLTLSTAGEAPKGLDAPDWPDSCLIWTLCGAPVVGVPLFVGPSGLPFGAQWVGRRYDDDKLLSFIRFLHERDLIPAAAHPEPAICSELSSTENWK